MPIVTVKFHEVGRVRRSWEAGLDYMPTLDWIAAAAKRGAALMNNDVQAVPDGPNRQGREGRIIVGGMRAVGGYSIILDTSAEH